MKIGLKKVDILLILAMIAIAGLGFVKVHIAPWQMAILWIFIWVCSIYQVISSRDMDKKIKIYLILFMTLLYGGYGSMWVIGYN